VSGSTAEIWVVDGLSNGHLLARAQLHDLSALELVPEIGGFAPRLTGPIGVPNDVPVLPD